MYETANYSLEYYRYECDDLLEYLRVSDEQLDQWYEQQLEDVNAELQAIAADKVAQATFADCKIMWHLTNQS